MTGRIVRLQPIAETLRQIRALGLTAVYRSEWGEFRVNYRRDDPRWNGDGRAVYTSHSDDALQTARKMAVWTDSGSLQSRLIRGQMFGLAVPPAVARVAEPGRASRKRNRRFWSVSHGTTESRSVAVSPTRSARSGRARSAAPDVHCRASDRADR